MITDRTQILQTLRDADRSGHRSYVPSTFDPETARAQFGELARRIEASFSCELLRNPNRPQDTALLDYLGLPVEVTRASDSVWILISRFSPLAMYHVGRVNPGGTDNVEDQLSVDVRNRIDLALSETGYTVVPNAVLWETYDGTHEGLRRVKYDWFTRYFDHH